MMMNYFSPMDPSSSYLSLNWISILIPLILLPLNTNKPFNRFNILFSSILNNLKKEIKPLTNHIYTQGFHLIFLSIFAMIILSNLMGLFPHTFTHTSHMTFNLPLSFTFWLILMIYSWLNSTNFMFAHLIPQSTPLPLIPFMTLIELISQIIRPLTLAIRLTTNMIAGHLLLTLLATLGPILSLNMYPYILLPQLILMTLETAVASIQAYVFMILLILYSTEIN